MTYRHRVDGLVLCRPRPVGAGARSEQAQQELLSYVTQHAEAINTVDRLRLRVSRTAQPL
jgi:hypothetical protein